MRSLSSKVKALRESSCEWNSSEKGYTMHPSLVVWLCISGLMQGIPISNLRLSFKGIHWLCKPIVKVICYFHNFRKPSSLKGKVPGEHLQMGTSPRFTDWDFSGSGGLCRSNTVKLHYKEQSKEHCRCCEMTLFCFRTLEWLSFYMVEWWRQARSNSLDLF